MPLHYPAIAATILLVLATGSHNAARAQTPDADELEFYRTSNLTPLYGEQDGTMEKGAYVVIDDIVVRKGMTLSFQPGATVVLKKDKKILVAGKLTCEGSPRGTVTFTRLRNDQYYIPLDSSVDSRWDGIFLADSAELEMRYSNILDSKYGIEARPNFTRILLDTVLFRNNKVQNLKLGDKTVRLASGKYLSFQAPEVRKAEQKWKRPLRIALGGLALAGAGPLSMDSPNTLPTAKNTTLVITVRLRRSHTGRRQSPTTLWAGWESASAHWDRRGLR